jgi:hypothetical protein
MLHTYYLLDILLKTAQKLTYFFIFHLKNKNNIVFTKNNFSKCLVIGKLNNQLQTIFL